MTKSCCLFLEQLETLKQKTLKMEQGHLICFEVASQGRQVGSGEMREQKEPCGTKTLRPLHLFPLLPKAPLVLSYKPYWGRVIGSL